jgi:hypothetical protein
VRLSDIDPAALAQSVPCACGTSYSPAAWARLPYVGLSYGAEPGAPVELRNCAVCSSTISAPVEPSSADLVELLRQLRDEELSAEASGDWLAVESLLARIELARVAA